MSDEHEDLVLDAAMWLWRTGHFGKCPVVITEMASASPEHPDAIGFKNGHSVLVECKTSRADFRADRDKHFRQWAGHAMGNFRYYMTRPGLLDPIDLPTGWGLLEAAGNTTKRIVESAHHKDTDRAYEIELLASALRRQVCHGERGIRVKNYVFDDSDMEPRAGIIATREVNDDTFQ